MRGPAQRRLHRNLWFSVTRLSWVTALASIAPSQAEQSAKAPSRDHQRAAAAQLQAEWLLRWGEAGMPPLPAKVKQLGAVFSGDGRFLVLQIDQAWHCIDVATTKVTALPMVQKTLCGSVSGSRVHAWSQGGLSWVSLPSGEVEDVIPSVPPLRAARGGGVFDTLESARVWFVAPDGSRAIGSGQPQILDLGTKASIPFGTKKDLPFWAAWDLDRQRVAVSMQRAVGPTSLEVFDLQGKSLATFAAPTPGFTELDLGGRYVWWTGLKLCRGELATGKVTVAKDGPEQMWFWQADPVLGIGLDGTDFTLWNLTDLEPVRRVPIGEARPPEADAVEPITQSPLRWAKGCVLLGGAAATLRRERIALATFAGVRIYLIKN